MNSQNDVLKNLRELTDDERLDAREVARGVVLREIGERPERAAFVGTAVSEYPEYVRRLVGALMLVVFVAAAAPSLFRLYEAGRRYHLDVSASAWQAALVGVSTFLLAEFLIITSTIAASVFYRGWRRLVFGLPVGMGLAVAFVGNWTVVQPHDLFSWLETVIPPLAVLVISFIGERLLLDGIKSAHADEHAYQVAASQWQQATINVEEHPRWQQVYGRALVDALRKANTGGTGTKARADFMAALNRRDWAIAVRRELAIDRGDWLLEPEAAQEEPAPEPRPFGLTQVIPDGPALTPITRSANGHIANANA